MSQQSAALARSITRNSSKQSYFIARRLADADLKDDCLRAYAYFRWADDEIDVSARSAEERLRFIREQQKLIADLYRGARPDKLRPEEEMLADLISHDRGQNSGLHSFIHTFAAVLAFDAGRKGQLISQADLKWYSRSLGQAVTDAIQYFIGDGHHYPVSSGQYLAATAAHITHMLRDMADDLSEGFINIPYEWFAEHRPAMLQAAGPVDLDILADPAFRSWVQGQVALARACFRQGKDYLAELDVLRCQIAAAWYCARFECVLDAIERDDYALRPAYHEWKKLSTRLKMGWIALSLTLRRLGRRRRRVAMGPGAESGRETPALEH